MAHAPVLRSLSTPARGRALTGHRIRVSMAVAAAMALVVSLGAYGWNYYILPVEMRPFSPKHEILRPSGSIGLNLGILGTVLFLVIFLYAFRKAIPWLGRIGTAKHWMDFHVVTGITAPIVIAFHASFKFNNIAGVAFWVMFAVALSGFIGRYLYAQIPRSLGAAALSYKELQGLQSELADALGRQTIYTAERVERVFAMPSAEHIRSSPIVLTIAEMMWLDLTRVFRIAALRRKVMSFSGCVRTLGGILSTGDPEVERIVWAVRQKASLSKRILFLDRAQRIFHLWHVVHRPFSYAFVVLAIIHIVNAVRLGYL